MEKLSIIIVEDNLETRQQFRYAVSEHAEFELIGETGNPTEAEKMMRELRPDVVIIDLELEDGHGADILANVRPPWPNKQFRIVTTNIDTDIAQFSLEGVKTDRIYYKHDFDYSPGKVLEDIVVAHKKRIEKGLFTGNDLVIKYFIRQAREDRGLSQEDLAKLSGVSRAQIARIENKVSHPTVPLLAELAMGMQEPFSNLFYAGPASSEFKPSSKKELLKDWKPDGIDRDAIVKYRIKESRLKCGMTQIQLAKDSGVSKSTIKKIESGERDATMPILAKCAYGMGVTVRSVFSVNIIPAIPAIYHPDYHRLR